LKYSFISLIKAIVVRKFLLQYILQMRLPFFLYLKEFILHKFEIHNTVTQHKT